MLWIGCNRLCDGQAFAVLLKPLYTEEFGANGVSGVMPDRGCCLWRQTQRAKIERYQDILGILRTEQASLQGREWG
jgi:hypothetical protein